MLPDWPPGTVAVLSTGAGAPHAIPVSTAVRGGPRTVLLALGLRRESLARLRDDPRCALTVLAAGLAFTAHGHATVVGEPAGVAAVRLEVDHVQDHDGPQFEIEAAVAWRWTDDEAQRRDAAVRAGLREL